MALRQRRAGEATAVPRQHSRLVYLDFQPKSEQKEEAAETIIMVHLPGFVKERIKVTYVNCSRKVTVRGEQPILNNRWSRFNQVFPVPDNCDTDKIRAKFQHEVLSITMPMKIVARVTGPSNEEAAKKTQKAPSFSKSVSESKSQKVQEETDIPHDMPASTSGVEKRRRPEDIAQSRSLKRVATDQQMVEKGREDIPPKAKSSNAIDERKWAVKTNQSRSPPEATTEPNDQKGQDLASPKLDARNLTGTTSMASSAEKVDRQKSTGKKDNDHRNGKAKETEESENYVGKKMFINGKESGEKSADSFVKPESNAPKVSENRYQEKKERSSGGMMEEQMIGKHRDLKAGKGTVRSKSTVMDSAKQRVDSLAKTLINNEDKRQSLINICAAVLVIVALGVGAYLAYRYRSRL